MPRFVILEHDYPEQHWDLMLEQGNHLCAWKLKENPDRIYIKASKPISTIVSKASHDYKHIYLDYEGPLTNDRGFVTQFDQGTFEWLEQSDEQITISLQGKKLSGIAKFTKLTSNIEPDNWQLELSPLSTINQTDAIDS